MQSTNRISGVIRTLPGFCAALLIAAAAKFLEGLLPLPLIGASVIALFIGMFLNPALGRAEILRPGLRFTSKKILKFAIILLGASLSIQVVLNVGRLSLSVMVFTLLTCFGGGYFVGRLLGLNWKLSNLISAGTGICGGSAIAAIAPVIDAEDRDVAYAMSATFLFDMAMILLFPILGRAMGLSDTAYGLWAGTAVNDTSSVVAAGYAFSEAAGDFATMVKLTRTLSILPTVLVFSMIQARMRGKQAQGAEGAAGAKPSVLTLFPWFIVGFVALAALNSAGAIPAGISAAAKEISKFLMVAALGAIGLGTSFREMRRSGAAPMLHGFIISALVVLVALGVDCAIGLV